jgi:hypothetical protein
MLSMEANPPLAIAQGLFLGGGTRVVDNVQCAITTAGARGEGTVLDNLLPVQEWQELEA